MKKTKYDREVAIKYAKKWAYERNPKYYNFDKVGGDCTNFVSQCIYAGMKVMNYNKQNGWYYINGNNKSPSWTGVEFLYKFLINNNGSGPKGKEIEMKLLEKGDIAQLSFDGNIFSHTLIVVEIGKEKSLDDILIAAHTFNAYGKSLSSYKYKKIRFIHIE